MGPHIFVPHNFGSNWSETSFDRYIKGSLEGFMLIEKNEVLLKKNTEWTPIKLTPIFLVFAYFFFNILPCLIGGWPPWADPRVSRFYKKLPKPEVTYNKFGSGPK